MAMKDKIQGKAEELHGKMSDDKTTEMKGKARQTAGDMKEKAQDMTDKMKHHSAM